MEKLYVYYVLVDGLNAAQSYEKGIVNRLNIVIAESESSAISIMTEHLKPFKAAVNVPDFSSNSDATALGHGKDVSEFLDLTAERINYRDLLDSYRDRYNQYYGDGCAIKLLKLWDAKGEVLLNNDYAHGTYNKTTQYKDAPHNVFVTIESNREDELAGGIAFSASAEKSEEGDTLLSNSIVISESSISGEDGETVLDNLQVKLTVRGEILIREYDAESQTWSDWVLSPIFSEEAPLDDKSYVRTNRTWKALVYDSTPTSGSDNLVTSGNIKSYVDGAVVRVYRYQGSLTASEISKIQSPTVGDVYNVKDAGTITSGSENVAVAPGDNVAWDGSRWDNLNGILDLSNYVTFNDLSPYVKRTELDSYVLRSEAENHVTFEDTASYDAVGVVSVKKDSVISVSDSGELDIALSDNAEASAKQSSTKVLTPSNLDAAVKSTTHQNMSDDYDPSELSVNPDSGVSAEFLPVSYAAVKKYVDNIEVSGGAADVDLSPYQTQTDDTFTTKAKTVTGAITELNDKLDIVVSDLVAGWNTVKLNKTYPVSWVFAGKPHCVTIDGAEVDYRILNFNNVITDGVHSFDIYVPTECRLSAAVAAWSKVSGVPADYMLVSYYYTGNDGDDLDTMTVATGASEIGYAGYETGSSRTTITDSSGNILVKWGGDNTGGGSSSGNTKFYEEILLDLNAIRNYDNHDIEVALYGAWYESIGDGNIHVEVKCYKGSLNMNTVSANSSTKRFDLTSLGEPTYTNPAELMCYIPNEVDSGDSNNFRDTYAKVFVVNIHSTSATTNLATFEINRLA